MFSHYQRIHLNLIWVGIFYLFWPMDEDMNIKRIYFSKTEFKFLNLKSFQCLQGGGAKAIERHTSRFVVICID